MKSLRKMHILYVYEKIVRLHNQNEVHQTLLIWKKMREHRARKKMKKTQSTEKVHSNLKWNKTF